MAVTQHDGACSQLLAGWTSLKSEIQSHANSLKCCSLKNCPEMVCMPFTVVVMQSQHCRTTGLFNIEGGRGSSHRILCYLAI